MVEIGIKLNGGVQLPDYSRDGDACQDARSSEDVVVWIGGTVIVKTGLKVQHIPEGYKICAVARSGLSSKGIVIANAPGQIDENYRGEICLIVHNQGDYEFIIDKGDRLAQLYVERVIKFKFVEMDEETETNRGANGFNSSGVK